MTYKGTVKGKVIELDSDVALPEGTEVEVVVKDQTKNASTLSGHERGAPAAILNLLDTPPLCTPADVEALLQAIREGRQPARYEGIFDKNCQD